LANQEDEKVDSDRDDLRNSSGINLQAMPELKLDLSSVNLDHTISTPPAAIAIFIKLRAIKGPKLSDVCYGQVSH
jgi:hypothetical protein